MEVLQRLWELFFSLPWLDDMAYYLHSLPLYPLFTSVHFFLTALALRNEPGSVQFALKYPLASCVMSFIVASSGGILANLLLGAPPLDCVMNGWDVLVAVLSWYLVYFSPLDVFFYLCISKPVQLALYSVEEIARAKKILAGVTAASALYPQSILAMAVVGMIKGSGKKWGIIWYRLVYQPQSASAMELKRPSFLTKMAAFLAVLYAVNVQIQFCKHYQLLMVAAVCLMTVQFRSLFMAETDFFNPVLHYLWRLATALTIEPPPPQHCTAGNSIENDVHQHSPAATSTHEEKSQHSPAVTSTHEEKSQHSPAATSTHEEKSQHSPAVTSTHEGKSQHSPAVTSTHEEKSQHSPAATSTHKEDCTIAGAQCASHEKLE